MTTILEASQQKIVFYRTFAKFSNLGTEVTLYRSTQNEPWHVQLKGKGYVDGDGNINFCSLEYIHMFLEGCVEALVEYNKTAAEKIELSNTPL